MGSILVEKLQRANWLYHNTDTLSMTDDEFDKGLIELRRISPAHPFLSLVGEKVEKGTILPYVMGSLDKIRYGEGMLERWKKRMSAVGVKSYMITDKLDGLSALYIVRGGKRYLYLRGDGVKGVDISCLIDGLDLPAPSPKVARGLLSSPDGFAVRGELVLPTKAIPVGSIGRSLINGWVHRKAIKELAAVHFVAYQVFEQAGNNTLSRKEQGVWLSKNGFKQPWTHTITTSLLSEELAKDILVNRRRDSEYPLDGIVIGADCVPATVGGGEARNPSDCIAFKASLDEQKQQTIVVSVEWNASRKGCLIPRIQIEPVTIGGANIQWLSGHNASLIYKNGIGPGARIVVRRSGDVIPTLDTVLMHVTASMPSGNWVWDEKNTHAIVAVANESILHAFQTLGVNNVGPGICDKLLSAGLNTMALIWKTSEIQLGNIIGTGRGPALYENLRVCMAKATQMQLLIASNMLPRGVGEKKLRVLYSVIPDASKWNVLVGGKSLAIFGETPSQLKGVAGWSDESLNELLIALPNALAWARPFITTPYVQPIAISSTKCVVFTGVRNKELEAIILTNGWCIEPSLTKKTTVLVISDDLQAKETSKVKKAREVGIRIMPIAEFRTFALAN